jgi:hypothetical protein
MENETGEWAKGDVCANCGGRLLQRHEYLDDNKKFFNADVVVEDGNLQSYSFDGGPLTDVPGGYPSDVVSIKYPENFSHLCVRYNREGDPRINVVAVNQFTMQKIRPSKPTAKSDDWTFPIESARITGIEGEDGGPVGPFQWEDTQPTVFLDKQPGAWTIAPAAFPWDLKLTAKTYLDIDPNMPEEEKLRLKFVSWERNRLSNWFEGDKHQWSGHDEGINGDTIHFGISTYAGVIAYYLRDVDKLPEPVNIPDHHIDWPIDEGPTPPEDPAREVRWSILSAPLLIWRWIVVSVKRVFRLGGGD